MRRLYALPGFKRVVNARPVPSLLLGLGLAHGAIWTIAFVVEGRWLQWHQQYRAFVYGDVLLAVAMAATSASSNEIVPEHWSQRRNIHTGAVAAFTAFGIWRWAFKDYHAYTAGQSASPTKLYHDTLFVSLAYIIFAKMMPLVRYGGSVEDRQRLFVACAAIAGWLVLGISDQGDGWKTTFAHVDHDWPLKDFVVRYLEPLLRK